MNMLLRLIGAGLLLLAGSGGGAAVYWHRREKWRQLHTFAQLLAHLQSLLDYQPLPVEQLLQNAAQYPDFAALGLTGCQSLAELPLPNCLDAAMRAQITAELNALGCAPRHTVCAALGHLNALCMKESDTAEQQARQARQLYPRLGACFGILAAILFL